MLTKVPRVIDYRSEAEFPALIADGELVYESFAMPTQPAAEPVR